MGVVRAQKDTGQPVYLGVEAYTQQATESGFTDFVYGMVLDYRSRLSQIVWTARKSQYLINFVLY